MTRIIVKLRVTNSRPHPVTKTIPKGRIIEVAEPSSGYQVASVARDYPITIPPSTTVTIYVEAECAIKRKAWPSKVRGNLTPYLFAGPARDQEDLWRQLAL